MRGLSVPKVANPERERIRDSREILNRHAEVGPIRFILWNFSICKGGKNKEKLTEPMVTEYTPKSFIPFEILDHERVE